MQKKAKEEAKKEEVWITLPGKEELRERLMSVISSDYVVEHFYPHILPYAGTVVTPLGADVILTLALTYYTESLEDASAAESAAASILPAFPLFMQALGVPEAEEKAAK